MNSLTIDGTRTWEDLGLVLSSKTLSPPAPSFSTVNVPGRSGSLDLTVAAYGDVPFGDREQEFVFTSLVGGGGFETLKTRLCALIDGRDLDYQLSWDPGYTYHGRFSVDSYEADGPVGKVTIKVTAEPYKRKGTYTYRINAAGGVTLELPVGRKMVCPVIEVQCEALVSKGGTTWTLEPGTSRIRDLWVSSGDSTVTINTYPGYCIAKWSDDPDETWAAGADELWSTECAAGQPLQEYPTWATDPDAVWATEADRRWVEEMHPAEAGDEYGCYMQYDWCDL